jgi:uncharacterized protein (DUF4415 family)
MKKQPNKKKRTVTYTNRGISRLKDKTNYHKLDNMSDSDIDYSDIPETDKAFWSKAEVIDAGKKKAISLRVDYDVLDWFKSKQGRYQRLINQVLRQYMNAHR